MMWDFRPKPEKLPSQTEETVVPRLETIVPRLETVVPRLGIVVPRLETDLLLSEFGYEDITIDVEEKKNIYLIGTAIAALS